jgi:hypothetical protein
MFQESQVVPAFMLTINPENISNLYQYYKSTLRPTADSISNSMNNNDDGDELKSTNVSSTVNGGFEHSIDELYIPERRGERDRFMQLETLV